MLTRNRIIRIKKNQIRNLQHSSTRDLQSRQIRLGFGLDATADERFSDTGVNTVSFLLQQQTGSGKK